VEALVAAADAQAEDQPVTTTLPAAERTEAAAATPGDRPFAKFGPYPTGASGSFLTVAVWKREVVVEGGEVVTVMSASLQRSYRDAEGNIKNSSSLRSGELQLAILLLEKADRFIREHKEQLKVPNGH
jgi:uncharacterized protein YfaS (alpha-2-macroglobulin family)